MASGQTYTAREIAEVMGASVRTVQRRSVRECWPRALVRIQGGESCAYPADGLPADVRAALKSEPGPTGAAADDTPPAVSAYEAAAAYNRDIADRRLAVLKAWDAWRAGHPEQPLMESRPAFLSEWAASEEKAVSLSSCMRWERAYKEHGLDGLVPGYGTSAGRTSIPDEARNAFLALYFNQSQLAIARCRELTIDALRGRGLDVDVPSVDAFGRLVQSLDQGVVVYARKGKGAWRNTVAPFQQRTFEHQDSNDTWVGDHKRFDVFCRGAKPGVTVRPWLSAWADQRSRMFTGWHVNTNPCGDTILLSFRRGALERGLPREWYIDNGADYRSFTITGAGGRRGRRAKLSEKASERRYLSLADQVGVEKVTFAIPGTPQAKIIERLFLTMKNHFDRLWLSFTGGTVVEKPERLEELCKRHWAKLPTLEEFSAMVDEYIRHDYNRRAHSELGGECPEQVWADHLRVKRTAPAERLRLMMLTTTRPHVLRRNGVELFGVWYDSPPDQPVQLAELFGREVYVRYDPANMGRVSVYDTDDRFLCEAVNRQVARHGLDQEMVRDAAKEKARRDRKIREGLKAQAELDRYPDVIDAYRAGRKADAEANPIPEPQVPTELVQPVRPSRPVDPGAPGAPIVSLADRRPVCAPSREGDEAEDSTAPDPIALMQRLVRAHEENVYAD